MKIIGKMGNPIIKKEYYFLLLKARIAYEGLVDFGDGIIAFAYNKLDIIRVDYNKYQDHYFSIKYTPVCIIPKNNASQNDDYYKVKQGDTLSLIALRNNVTVNELMNWNKINDKNKIEAGQTLIIRKAENIPKAKNTSNKNIFDNEVMDMANKLLSVASMAAEIKLASNNFKYLSSLAKNDKFLGINQYGELVEMHKTWLSTRETKITRGLQKAAFDKNLNRLRLIKHGSTIASTLSAVHSGVKFWNEKNLENGVDFGVSAASVVYWQVGAAYMYINVSMDWRKEQINNVLEMESKGLSGNLPAIMIHSMQYGNPTGPCP